MSHSIQTTCPFCNYPLEINLIWASKNGRVFCGTCCKSFEIEISKENEKDRENSVGTKTED